MTIIGISYCLIWLDMVRKFQGILNQSSRGISHSPDIKTTQPRNHVVLQRICTSLAPSFGHLGGSEIPKYLIPWTSPWSTTVKPNKKCSTAKQNPLKILTHWYMTFSFYYVPIGKACHFWVPGAASFRLLNCLHPWVDSAPAVPIRRPKRLNWASGHGGWPSQKLVFSEPNGFNDVGWWREPRNR